MENNENENFTSDEKNIILRKSIKKLCLSGIIYLIGYMNWSITWVIIPVIISIFNDERKKIRLKRRNLMRRAALGNEQSVILENIKDLPAWVYFPDTERAEWVNKIIKQLWPNLNHYVHHLIKKKTEGVLKRNLEKYSLKGFTFQRIILGSVPFRIGGVVVYDNVSRDEVVMDLDVSYAGDCDIKFRLRGLNGGIKNFQLYGRLRIVMKPLITSLPLVGGLQVFFLNSPEIDFDLDGIAGVLEVPGINDLLKKSIVDTVSTLMVLPNKFPIKLSKKVIGAQLKTPSAAGVLRIHVIEARDLLKKDIGLTGKSSDPYAVFEVGDQTCRTETINCTIDPKWDYWCEFIILEFSGQQLNMHVWDQDTTDDEFLGKASLDISNLTKAGSKDLWLNLEGVKHGKIHVRLTWLSLSTDYSDLQGAIYETQQLQLTNMNTALLIVYIDSATNLPQIKMSNNPDPYVQIQVGRQMKSTKTIMRTTNPVWEEGFIFFVNNPDSDFVDLKVVDAKTENDLCSLNYNISNLSNKENLEIVQQPFKLEGTTSESKIVWSLHLKILKNETAEYCTEESDNESHQLNSSNTNKSPLEKKYSDRSIYSNNSASEEFVGHTSKSIRSTRISRSSTSRSRSGRFNFRLSQEDEFRGRINLTLRYSVQRQRLIVVVHSLVNIPHKHQVGKNLYVKLYLLPERNKEVKRKTVVKNSNDPTYDESFEYLISQGELSSKKLEISVIEEKMMRNFTLGEVIIDLEKLNIFKPHTAWFELGPHLKVD